MGTASTSVQAVKGSSGSWDNADSYAIDVTTLIYNASDISSAALGGTSLAADIGPGSSYLIKRIVGNIDASVDSGVTAGRDSHGYAFAGLFIDRTDASGVLQNLAAWAPFGSGQAEAASGLKRWLWRRYWHLGDASANASDHDIVFPPYSASWMSYQATVLDCRAKARVTWEERLFLMYAVTGGSAATVATANFTVLFTRNLRMFAYPMMRNNR